MNRRQGTHSLPDLSWRRVVWYSQARHQLLVGTTCNAYAQQYRSGQAAACCPAVDGCWDTWPCMAGVPSVSAKLSSSTWTHTDRQCQWHDCVDAASLRPWSASQILPLRPQNMALAHSGTTTMQYCSIYYYVHAIVFHVQCQWHYCAQLQARLCRV